MSPKDRQAEEAALRTGPGRRLLHTTTPASSTSTSTSTAVPPSRSGTTPVKKNGLSTGTGKVGAPSFSALAGVGVTSQAYSPNQQWIALRSLATNTFVSVEPPPHADAMIVHGRGESISLNNVFGFLRGGFLWSKSIDSLLTVCSTKGEVCTGYLEKDTDPHLKRLQTPTESAHFDFRVVTSRHRRHRVEKRSV